MDRTSSAVRVGTKNYSQTTAIGISETYAGMTGTTIARGRGIQFVDCDDAKKICVVGDYIDRVAYGGNALGQTIKIGENQYTIVGVAAAEVDDPSLQEGSSDDYVYIPYTTAQRVARNAIVSTYGVTTIDESRVAEGKAVLEAGLAELLHSENGQGYFVTSLSEMLDTFSSMIGMVVTVLTVIAPITNLSKCFGKPAEPPKTLASVSESRPRNVSESILLSGFCSMRIVPTRSMVDTKPVVSASLIAR